MLIKLWTLQTTSYILYIASFYATSFIVLQGVDLTDSEETETEEQSVPSSSDMIENVNDQVEHLQF